MKTTVSYLLLNTAKLPHAPHACCGVSGKRYGWAQFSKEHDAHVLEISQEVYEGKPGVKGADRDLAEGMHRSLAKWVVRPKVTVELEDAEAELAAELDRTKAALAQSQVACQQLTADLDTLNKIVMATPAEPPTPEAKPAGVIGEAPAPVAPVETPKILTSENASEWSYPEMKALAKERGLDLGTNPSKKVLLAALLPAEQIPA